MNNLNEKIQKTYWEGKKKRRTPEHAAVREFVQSKLRTVKKFVEFDKNLMVLDIGCGNGFFTYYLGELACTIGADFSLNMLKKNPCKNLVNADAYCLPFKNKSFDIVFESNLLHHLSEPEKALSEMKRASRKFIILIEPNRNNPLNFLFHIVKKEERGALKFSLKYMKILAKKEGLKILYAKKVGSIVPNKTPTFLVPLLSRFNNEWFFGFYNLLIAQVGVD